MVNWQDPNVIKTASDIFAKSLLSFLGLYVWEFLLTLDFERSFFNSLGKRKWRWHYLSYFACRYSFLTVLISMNVTLNTTMSMNCQVIYTVNQLFGNIAIGTASLNLAFRALAIWRNNRILMITMGLLAIVHWCILFYCTTTLKATKNDTGTSDPCMVVAIDRAWLMTLYVYTMIFDTFIMVTCLWGLWRSKPRGGGRTNELYDLLWTDGLMYFICASVANTFPVAFMALSLNPAMDIVTTIAACVVTTIVSCRAVQRLNAWGASNPATNDSAYVMSAPARPFSGRVGISKGNTSEQGGIEHGRKRGWRQQSKYHTEGDVNLPSAIFAKTVLLDDEGRDPGNGTQYETQQKTRSSAGGGVFSLSADDRSMTSSPTTPAPWKQTPSITSASTQTTGNDKDKISARYKPATERVSESSEMPPFQTKPASLYQPSESIDEEDIESGYRQPAHHHQPTSANVPRQRGGSRTMGIGPTESDIGFGSGSDVVGGDSESDRERRQRAQWRG